MQIREILTVLFLAANSWMDWKKREISLLLTGAYGIVGVAASLYDGRNVTDWLIPMGAGMAMIAVSLLTSGEIGMGDAWMFLALGAMLSSEMFVRMACIGMFAAAGYAAILLVICKRNRKTEIPLVPFLLAGYIGGLLL